MIVMKTVLSYSVWHLHCWYEHTLALYVCICVNNHYGKCAYGTTDCRTVDFMLIKRHFVCSQGIDLWCTVVRIIYSIEIYAFGDI